jgi:tRNA(Ile)-lysidine synthase
MPDENTPASLSGTSFVAAVDAWAREHDLWPARGPILVGVSGGVDSMVLLHVLHALVASGARWTGEPEPLVVAHVNYGLRPGAGDDEALVRSVCAALTPPVPVEVLRADLSDGEAGERASLQERAREVRYAFFAEQAEAYGATAVAVGHHWQDQAETMLVRLFRGAGPEALAGMRPRRPLRPQRDISLIRPLLRTKKEKISRIATEHGIPWREDPSNTSGPYARAALRTAILPAIEAEFPGATGRVAHAATLLREVADTTLRPERLTWQARVVAEWQNRDDAGATWTPETDLALSRLTSILLGADALRDAPRVWRDRVILDALRAVAPDAPQTTGMARSVADLLDAQTGRRVDVGSGTVWRERTGLRVVSSPAPMGKPVPIRPGVPASTPEGTVTMQVLSPEEGSAGGGGAEGTPMDLLRAEGRGSDPETALLDADAMIGGTKARRSDTSEGTSEGTSEDAREDARAAVREALASGWVVRRWREGDRIQPLGMEGTKTVADVMTDAQVPPHVRERVLVVAGPTGIAWMVGYRINHRFRLQPGTRHVVQLRREDGGVSPTSPPRASGSREHRAAT